MRYFLPFSLGQSFWFASFIVPIWCISGSLCVYTSLRILPQRHSGRASLDIVTPLACKEPFMHVWFVEVFWLREWELWGQGRAQPPPLIVKLLSSWEFWSIGDEPPTALPWRGRRVHLPPASSLVGFLQLLHVLHMHILEFSIYHQP